MNTTYPFKPHYGLIGVIVACLLFWAAIFGVICWRLL